MNEFLYANYAQFGFPVPSFVVFHFPTLLTCYFLLLPSPFQQILCTLQNLLFTTSFLPYATSIHPGLCAISIPFSLFICIPNSLFLLFSGRTRAHSRCYNIPLLAPDDIALNPSMPEVVAVYIATPIHSEQRSLLILSRPCAVNAESCAKL